jgi:hypothetical protein
MILQARHQVQRRFAGIRRRLKAALVEVGLRLMGSPSTGPLVTRLVQQVVTTIVRWGRLANA